MLQVEVVNKKNQVPKQLFYDVRVKYDGKDYDLQNVHGLSGYSNGKSVKALLANGKLYANVEGIKSTSPIAITYFVFYSGTIAMVVVSATYMSKAKAKEKKKNKKNKKKKNSN